MPDLLFCLSDCWVGVNGNYRKFSALSFGFNWEIFTHELFCLG
jgi:hypothetical protein